MSYSQLTLEQRYQIYAMKKAGFKQNQIAAEIFVDPSTVSRELRRNRGRRGYRPKQAHEKAQERKQIKVKARILPPTWRLVETYLVAEQWSPEQISGYLKRHGLGKVSAERIYQHIYADKQSGGTLYRHLRCQKKRKKRYGKLSRRGAIPNRRTIDERPAVVEEKSRLGDWEADTIIGKNHQQAIVSLVDRKTKYCLLAKVAQKTAAVVEAAICRKLARHKAKVKTITSDNGREFAHHEQIARHLEADFFFAHPYHSWERGVNENTNGLVRQYFPKKMAFEQITDEQIQAVEDKLNSRPRKRLGYQTPKELFFKEQKIALAT
jgi:Transposase and inactivated derivatives, IS30 family